MKLFCVFMNSICRDESRYTRHVRVISGYPIFIDFQRLTGCRRDPQVLDVACSSRVFNEFDYVFQTYHNFELIKLFSFQIFFFFVRP